MELAQLKMFVAVAETGSITRAAETLHRAPSNISTRIKQLEQEIGVQLLVRDKRQSSLSVDGKLFLEYAERIVDLSEEARTFSIRDEPKGPFHLGALDSTAAVRIPPLLAAFHMQYPAVELELHASSSGDLLKKVLDGDLTAAFTDGKPEAAALAGMKVFDEELVIITPKSIQSIDQLRDSNPTAFVFGTNCSYRQRLEDWLQMESIHPGRSVQLANYHSMVACVASGAGITLIPRSLLETLPWSDQVRAHQMRDDAGKVETWLMWRRDCRSPNLFAFMDEVEDQIRHSDWDGALSSETGPLSEDTALSVA